MKDNTDRDQPVADYYLSPASEAGVEQKIQGSRFIGRVFRVGSPNDVAARMAEIRKEMYDASHHCSAWRIGPDGATFRHDDDGEPAGTAGPPILRRIEGRNLSDCLVVVTRYFGGTKLGTGGLVRAYGDAADEALQLAGETRVPLRERFTVRFAYEDTSVVMRAVELVSGEVVDSVYGAETILTIDVPSSRSRNVASVFRDATRGKVVPKLVT